MKGKNQMRLFLALLVTACAADQEAPSLDPSGNWAMQFHWKAGNCGGINSTPARMIVTADLAVTSKTATLPDASGSFIRDTNQARFSGYFQNTDALDDGGSTINTLAFMATVDATNAITGSGAESVVGQLQCQQDFTITGELD